MASVASLVTSVLRELRHVIEEDMTRESKLQRGLQFIWNEMPMVDAKIEESTSKQAQHQGTVQERWVQQLKELAYDIEDFLECLREPGTCGRVLLVAAGIDPRQAQLEKIESFKERIKSLKEWQPKDAADEPSEGGDTAARRVAVESDPEVINGPKKKLMELILSPDDLRVISIVGCRGVGKTSLARAIYSDDSLRSQFDCVAWFNASGCKDLLSLPPEKDEMEPTQTTVPDNIRNIPLDKKFLIFIDDVHVDPRVFKATVGALRGSHKMTSRIIVTTSVRSVAHACSSGSYVFTMRCLGEVDSQKLFWRKIYGPGRNPSDAVMSDSKGIFSKCGGLPLALDSIANDLSIQGEYLEGSHCTEAVQNLGKDEGIKKALFRCYDKLLDYDHRVCLLHLSTFPRDHQIKSKCLVRRLMAEGLVTKAQDGRTCLNNLTDHRIVDPVQLCSDSRDAKRYGFHGPVLECIIQEAASKNVVTLIQEGGIDQSMTGSGASGPRIRRLSVQSKIQDQETCDWSAVRSVTSFSSKFDFRSCKLLRLLDLEGCTWLSNTYDGNSYLDSICEMPLLKYLSLRGTGINELPRGIEKLQRLEMLDVRDDRETGTVQLSIEVIMLPKLAYLFGKFVLTVPRKELLKLQDFLTKKSELHTLSGFVFNEQNQGLELLILCARKLKKVKVWSNNASSNLWSSNTEKRGGWFGNMGLSRRYGTNCRHVHDQPSDKLDFIRLLKDKFRSLESVSIDSSYGHCHDFLGSLGGPCTVSSIKLRGQLNKLPDSTKLSRLGHIRMLQLFSTGLSCEELSTLQKLRCLEYLKLEEDGDCFGDGDFIVEKKGFPSLKRLCIKAPMLPLLQFEGVMANLISLHLLCPVSFECHDILNLTNLNEVVLHMHATDDAVRAWETIANRHLNRPWVKKQAAK